MTDRTDIGKDTKSETALATKKAEVRVARLHKAEHDAHIIGVGGEVTTLVFTPFFVAAAIVAFGPGAPLAVTIGAGLLGVLAIGGLVSSIGGGVAQIIFGVAEEKARKAAPAAAALPPPRQHHSL